MRVAEVASRPNEARSARQGAPDVLKIAAWPKFDERARPPEIACQSASASLLRYCASGDGRARGVGSSNARRSAYRNGRIGPLCLCRCQQPAQAVCIGTCCVPLR